MRQADGQMVEDGRSYRVNAFGRYTFTETVLKGGFIGGGYRWRSRQTLGYKSSLVDNIFKFPGAPAQVQVPALDAPVYGKPIEETELLIGYQRKLGRRITWRGQLNIRNVFDARTILAQRANLSGFISVYSVPEPRSFILTNTFSF
jgi:outer membrane receptor protein involved in Fe transport